MAERLAKVLRATQDHDDEERHDLANFTQTQAHDLVTLAFTDPLEAKEPLRFTFIIGGGKLVRQKYNDDLGKWLCTRLREIGYADDKSASLGSDGVYKMQHDLGQNLVYLHVFPKRVPQEAGGAAEDADGEEPAGASSLADSAQGRCLSCEISEFEGIVQSRAAQWSHKRRLLAFMQSWLDKLDTCEAKMVARQPLTASEQAEYDVTGRGELQSKITWLQADMKGQVSDGRLTSGERETVLGEIDAKLASLGTAKKEAEGEKKVAAIQGQIEALEGRKAALKEKFKACTPSAYPIKASVAADIRKVKNQIAAVDKVERANAGKVISVAERIAVQKQLDTRPELEDRLMELTIEARGWFESEAEWNGRLAEQLGGRAAGAAAGGRR